MKKVLYRCQYIPTSLLDSPDRSQPRRDRVTNNDGIGMLQSSVRLAAKTAPECSRPAARRKHGVSKCFAHWAVEWHVDSAGTRSGRWVYAIISAFMFINAFGWASQFVVDTFKGKPSEQSAIQLAQLVAMACWTGGLVLAFVSERVLGGWLWFVSSPPLFMTLVFSGINTWLGRNTSPFFGSMSNVGLVHVFVALAAFIFAVAVTVDWLRFIMHFREWYRWIDHLKLFSEVLIGVMVLIGVILAIASRGAESGRLIQIVLALGAIGLVRSARQIAKLVRRLRV